MSYKLLLIPILLIVVLSLCPEPSQGQFGPPGGFGGSPGGMGGGPPGGFGGRSSGMGGGSMDADGIWNMMGGAGKDSIDINQNPFLKMQMERRGTPLPPGGILTKAQFKADFEKRMAERANGGGGRGGMGGPPGGMTIQMGGPGGGMGGPPGMGGGGSEDVENRFKQSDRNGDGKISLDEASMFLKPVFQQYDKNGDGFIDMNEYRVYFTERFSGGGRGMGGPGSMDTNSQPQWGGGPPPWAQQNNDRGDRSDRSKDRKQEEEDTRPVVYRYGKMPKEIPSWFEDLDTDRDGMVGLYEWRRKSKPTADFVKMDLNGDGYLTAYEWLRFQKLELEKKKTDEDSGGSGAFGGFSGGSSSSRGSDSGSSSSKGDRERSSKGDRPSKDDKGNNRSPWRKN